MVGSRGVYRRKTANLSPNSTDCGERAASLS